MSEVGREKIDGSTKEFKSRRQAAMAAEIKRQEKELADLKAGRAVLAQREAKRTKEREQLAAKLQPIHQTQEVVESRMTEKTTKQLMVLLRYIALKPKSLVAWIAVDKALAMDVMHRAYPMALQMGLMCHCRDQDITLRFSNGSTINFAWPGKEGVVA